MLENVTDNLFTTENAAIASAAVAVVATGIKAFLRRPGKTSQGGAFFTDADLLKPPMSRPAYSDRMAYVLAEMSALAYFRFEDTEDGALEQAVEKFRRLEDCGDGSFEESIGRLLMEFRDDLLVNAVDSRGILEKILKRVDFQLLDTINIGTTQAFACKRVKTGEPPYIVIAFRGTEKVLDDWLTDADAVPEPALVDKGIKVHRGFWEALNSERDEQDRNVLECIAAICESADAKDGDRKLPCYFTGHSLGGALALLTTRELVSDDVEGACYTFGAPRVANYEYFRHMKTPVYRVVNSSDIVPRVPPGAGMGIVLKVVQGLGWVTQFVPGTAKPLEWLEQKVDQLNGYRHHGDQRYLTDVKSGSFKDLRLLSNPPAIDRIWWMWQHLRTTSLVEPVKSHGMAIYRRKLRHIAMQRNPEAAAQAGQADSAGAAAEDAVE